MKQLFLLFICFSSAFCYCQTYTITGVSANLENFTMAQPGQISKTNGTIIIDDSSYTQIMAGVTSKYKIVKKVDSSYFQISDGIKTYTIRVSSQKFKKYSGIITEEFDKGTMYLWFK